MRGIQLHIDLVSGSVLPNKPIYRMSTKKHEELNRQVDELLERGLIRKSMSSCTVLALLVPKKMNAKYVQQANPHKKFVKFQFGDLVWVLHGLFKVLERIGENAYKLEIPDEYDISSTFNVKNLWLTEISAKKMNAKYMKQANSHKKVCKVSVW
ncbi:hypothetical protein CRYUN_Cryun06bG0076900 [Craigia yunnanensis]